MKLSTMSPEATISSFVLKTLGLTDSGNRIDTGHNSPVFEIAHGRYITKIYLDPKVTKYAVQALDRDTKKVARLINGQVIKNHTFDTSNKPWTWYVNPIRKKGITRWDGRNCAYTLSPRIHGPQLSEVDPQFGQLVCRELTSQINYPRVQPGIVIASVNVRIDYPNRRLVIIKPWTQIESKFGR